jgi:menaquinone-dependent protoporphyrinogen oxidase
VATTAVVVMVKRKSGDRPGTPLAKALSMKTALFFATSEGQTRRITDRIASDLRSAGVGVDVIDLDRMRLVNWVDYAAACVLSSVHLGKHEPSAVEFARRHRSDLVRLSAAFVSVSLSEAGVEDLRRSESDRKQSAADVQDMIDRFVRETGWQPARVLPVAGALAYTRYNIFLRFVMKQIARKAGGPTDTSRDHELTDWAAVDRFAQELARR